MNIEQLLITLMSHNVEFCTLEDASEIVFLDYKGDLAFTLTIDELLEDIEYGKFVDCAQTNMETYRRIKR